MKTQKNLGIWMDHSIAYIMEMKNDSIITAVVKSEFTSQERKHSLAKNENLMHHKQHDLIASYFKEIEDHIQGFDEVILFGPGNAKNELFNHLANNPLFGNVEITVSSSDKLTENQRKAYVKDHFETTR